MLMLRAAVVGLFGNNKDPRPSASILTSLAV
jgi:hypothetical protein